MLSTLLFCLMAREIVAWSYPDIVLHKNAMRQQQIHFTRGICKIKGARASSKLLPTITKI